MTDTELPAGKISWMEECHDRGGLLMPLRRGDPALAVELDAGPAEGSSHRE